MSDKKEDIKLDKGKPDQSELPQHIAVIMDGNGRWARQRGLPRIAGHRRGLESVRKLIRGCGEIGIPYITLFAFSSENWRRPPSEVKLLMELFKTVLESEVRKLHENNIRLRVVGNLARFSSRIQLLVRSAEELTAKNTALNLTIAANYGGRWDITEACRKIAQQLQAGEIGPDEIDEARIGSFLCTRDLPEPDLFIRTGGEQRISNFLIWQLAYTELYITEVLWPDFGQNELSAAIAAYAGRQRRFGQTSEQVAAHRRANNA